MYWLMFYAVFLLCSIVSTYTRLRDDYGFCLKKSGHFTRAILSSCKSGAIGVRIINRFPLPPAPVLKFGKKVSNASTPEHR